MHGEAGRPERADLGVGVHVRVVVAVVEHERALCEEEEDEAGADEQADAVRVADGLDRLGQHVEERHRDDDTAGERDRGRELPRHAEGDDAAGQRREDGHASQRDRDPVHAQRLQVP